VLLVGWAALRRGRHPAAITWAARPFFGELDFPTPAAALVPAIAFGMVHAGPDVLALLPVHIALMSAAGIAGGAARARLGSLWVPIGVHVGADIALYVGLACRAAAVATGE